MIALGAAESMMEPTQMDFQKFKKSGPKSLLKLRLAFARQLEPEPVFGFSRAVASETTRRLKELARQKKEEAKKIEPDSVASEILGTYFEDEVSLTEAISEIAAHFSIVALYSQVEIRTKQMCSISLPNATPGALFRWKNLKDFLLKNGIELEKMARYDEVNQLRCLNNAIKHGDRVDDELAGTGWDRKRAAIDANMCRQKLRGFADASEVYLKDLHSKLAKVLGGLTDEQIEKILKLKG